MYADTSFNQLRDDMQYDMDMDTISRYFFNNKLTVNSDKTKYIIFHHQNKVIPNFDLFLNTKRIERVDDILYLGLPIQSNCKWNKQIDHIKSKIVPLIGVCRRIFPMIPV
jgi:hypothetical protein